MDKWKSGEFIDLFGNREITLMSDTEPAIIVFTNRVAEKCAQQMSPQRTERKETRNRTVSSRTQLIRGTIRTIKCHI